ncbi:MAG: GGDEF domain-containing protein [Pseudomonadales bacterium]
MIDRISQPFYLPAIFFGFAFLTSPYHRYLPESFGSILELGPYWALTLIGFLAAIFNRGKIFLTTAVVLCGYTLLDASGSEDLSEIQRSTFAFIVTLLIPINLGIISLYRERGVLTTSGGIRLSILVTQAAAVFYLLQNNINIPSWYEGLVLVPPNLWPTFLPQEQWPFYVSVIAFTVSLSTSLIAPTPIKNSVFGATLGYCLLIWLQVAHHIDAAFVIAIVLLLANGLLRDYYNMAYRDELTGLPQRRALNEQMLALGRHYTLAMLDVDHFKKFNDAHGHDIGDQVLQMVASQIKKVTGGGKAFRYGGEEFTVVFSGKDIDEAEFHLEKVRAAIENYEMVIRQQERSEDTDNTSKSHRKKGSFRRADQKVSVTISIGVASRQSRNESPDDVLKFADEALYKAKGGGRNRVSLEPARS